MTSFPLPCLDLEIGPWSWWSRDPQSWYGEGWVAEQSPTQSPSSLKTRERRWKWLADNAKRKGERWDGEGKRNEKSFKNIFGCLVWIGTFFWYILMLTIILQSAHLLIERQCHAPSGDLISEDIWLWMARTMMFDVRDDVHEFKKTIFNLKVAVCHKTKCLERLHSQQALMWLCLV